MANCRNCGHELPDNSQICPNCGVVNTVESVEDLYGGGYGSGEPKPTPVEAEVIDTQPETEASEQPTQGPNGVGVRKRLGHIFSYVSLGGSILLGGWFFAALGIMAIVFSKDKGDRIRGVLSIIFSTLWVIAAVLVIVLVPEVREAFMSLYSYEF